MTFDDVPYADRMLKKEFLSHQAPIIELIEAQTKDPVCVLVGTILSSRTKDACTAGAVGRLFAAAKGRCGINGDRLLAFLDGVDPQELSGLIYPVGFYREKTKHLKALPRAIRELFGGRLPNTVEELCRLPGVGRKTANLTVAVGFNLPAICVDVHVHRICDRCGLIKTEAPFETEMALRESLPEKYWKTWNSHIVSFGQTRCSPRNPDCRSCPLAKYCRFYASANGMANGKSSESNF